MADPIVTDWFKAQWVWKGHSGLPQDVFVNSWAFQRTGMPGAAGTADDIAAVLRAFYLDVEPATGRSIVSFLSPVIGPDAELRVYDLGQAPPREPIIRPITPLPARAGFGLPAEVAITLSFFADRNLPRRRGRLYMGPLGTGVSDTESNSRRVRVLPLFANTVLGRAANVKNNSRGVSWGVLSRADRNAFRVTDAWVDDAFDTQRRRGERTTLRTTRKL